MTRTARAFLIITALLVAGFIGMAGVGFAQMANPPRDDAWTFGFWSIAALLVSCPLWIPALVPERHARFFKVVRRLSALALVLPTLFFAKMFEEQVRFNPLGAIATGSAGYYASLVLMCCCLTCWVLLLRPEIVRLRACLFAHRSP